jgi:hypothetical protein
VDLLGGRITGTWPQTGLIDSLTAGVNVSLVGTPANPIINASELDPPVPSGSIAETARRFPAMSNQTLTVLPTGVVTFFPTEVVAGTPNAQICLRRWEHRSGQWNHAPLILPLFDDGRGSTSTPFNPTRRSSRARSPQSMAAFHRRER